MLVIVIGVTRCDLYIHISYVGAPLYLSQTPNSNGTYSYTWWGDTYLLLRKEEMVVIRCCWWKIFGVEEDEIMRKNLWMA